MNRFLLLASFLILSTLVFAQNKTNSVCQRTNLADLVIEGRVIQTKASGIHLFTISSRDFSSLSAGVYFLTIKSFKGIYTQKLIRN